MKVTGVFVKDSKTGKVFAFLKQIPAICAQGDSIEEARVKVEKYYREYAKRATNSTVELKEAELPLAC